MRISVASLGVLAAFALSANAFAEPPGPPAASAAQAKAPAAEREAAYTFAFQDADVQQAAQEVFGAIGVPYVIDPSVTGKISFRIEQRLTRVQLLQAFEAALAANDIALVRDGDSVVVTAKTKARASAALRPVGEGARRLGYEIVAVPLSYASATEVAKALEAISGPGSVVYADERLGLLVLGGGGQELQAALEAIKIFDQSGLQGSRIRWFDLSSAAATTVADELETMISAAKLSGITVLPLKRLNGILVLGQTSKALDEVSPWISRLDTPVRDAVAGFWVYHPKNTSAEALSRTLAGLVGGQVSAGDTEAASRSVPSTAVDIKTAGVTPASSSGPAPRATGGEENVRVAVDKDTNTLIISAPIWRWLPIQRMLAELDRPQAQILIEASVLEVTLGDNFRFGVDWTVFGNDHHIQASSIGNRAGAITPSYPGFSLTFLDTDVQAAISALGSRTSVEVVSAPKIITLDNRTARLQVGDQVPIVTQTSQNTSTPNAPVINNVDYRNSGVILNVTPRVAGENRIVLDISQEVSSVVQTDTSGIDSPTIQQRKFESTLTLRDGGVVALGGLISRTRNSGNTGIPGLKDVPGLGRLFSTNNHEGARTELIVLLRARVMVEPDQSDGVMRSLFDDMRELKARGLLDGRL
jgi:general secretion pathway protein D